MNQPNPQKEYRNRLIEAVKAQQRVIAQQGMQISVLSSAVSGLLKVAGIEGHPRFAALMKQADDDTPATTTEQARTPDATDDPTSSGAAPAGANTGVTPDAVTDVQNTNVAIPDDTPLDNLQDVTAPTPGTDAVDSGAVFNGDVKSFSPSSDTMDPKPADAASVSRSQSSMGGEQERFVASVRLARLQISAGLAQGEDMSVAETIAAGGQPLSEINSLAQTLTAVQAAQTTRQPTDQHRRLVPQAARTAQQGGVVPSLQSQPTLPAVTGSREGEDQFVFGFDGIE